MRRDDNIQSGWLSPLGYIEFYILDSFWKYLGGTVVSMCNIIIDFNEQKLNHVRFKFSMHFDKH